MPPAIPPPLASYLESSLASPHSQTLITSVLSTPSPWLCLRIIYAALYGVGDDSDSRHLVTRREGEREIGRPVILVSFLRPLTLWLEMGKKIGVDLPSLLRSKHIVFIDGLSYDSSPTRAGSEGGDASLPPTTRLNSLGLNDLRKAINRALENISTVTATAPSTSTPSSSIGTPTPRLRPPPPSPSKAPETTKPLLLLDSVDFLLACQPSLSAISLQAFLSTLRTQSHGLVLTCNADAPLVQTATSTSSESETPLEHNHAHFLTTMAHQSRWVFQLRGLDTGSAKDVAGVVRVSRGGDSEGDEHEMKDITTSVSVNVGGLSDAEWLYQLKGDGSVRVWGRGE